tara:strand:+ start:460 stop:639 length:180 start_codon:yes stop_codon:yes gene_type:complete
MSKLENIIKIISPSEFETLATRVGGDEMSRIELINAILDINSLMEGAKGLVNPQHRRKK